MLTNLDPFGPNWQLAVSQLDANKNNEAYQKEALRVEALKWELGKWAPHASLDDEPRPADDDDDDNEQF